jgi:hypothetical protein
MAVVTTSQNISPSYKEQFSDGGFEINTFDDIEWFKNHFIQSLTECIEHYKSNSKEIEEVGIEEYFKNNL